VVGHLAGSQRMRVRFPRGPHTSFRFFNNCCVTIPPTNFGIAHFERKRSPMSTRNFMVMLAKRWQEGHYLCVGLDSDYNQIPEAAHRGNITNTIRNFNSKIVKKTNALVCAYKLNYAYYAAYGSSGLAGLRLTIRDIIFDFPDIPIILDVKRGDIGATNAAYAVEAFDIYQADAVTVHGYLGGDALKPFLDRPNKGVFVLCKTSNPGAGEIQDLLVDGVPLYLKIAEKVANEWNTPNYNCGLVVGATYPDDLKKVREVAGDIPLLIPGIGKQGGDLAQTVTAAKSNFISNASSSIIFASNGSDYPDAAGVAASRLAEQINLYRQV
jgi:orotidine-5'-phosphate decarboxylase